MGWEKREKKTVIFNAAVQVIGLAATYTIKSMSPRLEEVVTIWCILASPSDTPAGAVVVSLVLPLISLC